MVQSILVQATTWGLISYASMVWGQLALPHVFTRMRTIRRIHIYQHTETPGNIPPNFLFDKKKIEVIAQILALLLKWIQCWDQRGWTTGVPEDVSNVSDTLLFPLPAQEKERPWTPLNFKETTMESAILCTAERTKQSRTSPWDPTTLTLK